MKRSAAPYRCHLFVCTNTRDGERKACGDASTAAELKAEIKAEIEDRGWKGTVRVSASGCLGVCEEGPNIMLYPQGIWFSAVKLEDLPAILQAVDDLLKEKT